MSAAAIRRPGALDTGLLAVAVLALSTSAPIIAACAAPALAIAFWRCAIGAAATAPWSWRDARNRLRLAGRSRVAALPLAGLFLAAHFGTWIPSLRFTSVAAATALVATQPVWAAMIARARGLPVAGSAWIGIGISLTGVVLLTGIDLSLNPQAVLGDLLALAGAMFAAGYVSAGEHARQALPTGLSTLVIYAVAALVLLPVCLATGTELSGYPARDWVLILLLTGIAQLVGHTVIAYVLQRTSATVTSLAILFELPGAVSIAAVWLGTWPPIQLLPALALLVVGLVVVIRGTPGTTESPPV